MEKILIEVLDETAMNELRKMQEDKKILIIGEDKKTLTQAERRKKIEALEGSWSNHTYEELINQLNEMRNEWERKP